MKREWELKSIAKRLSLEKSNEQIYRRKNKIKNFEKKEKEQKKDLEREKEHNKDREKKNKQNL